MIEYINQLTEKFSLPLQSPVLIFSLILFIILLSPILLKRLNIPGIIGLILSGVVIGPHGLGILENDSAIDLFSTIGLLYIMFIAGLELDMNDFKANQNKSLTFGFLAFIFPLALGFPVCYYLLSYDFNASFLTASMFATHTLVAYPIVSKMGVSKNQAVAITVGGTVLTDTGVLIILAIIMGNAGGNLNSEFWIRLVISLIIFSIIMFLIVPRIAKWFFSKLESEKHSHYIFVLAVVFFSAFLAEVAGVEAIIGAFAAGLALNSLIPNSSALMNRIEFIGNSLFIPFFLISVGMLVDVRVLMTGVNAWVVALTLSVVALFGKWVSAFVTQLLFKYSKAQRQLIFGLSGAHAAATLAVVLVGYKAKILDEAILNGTIILILITCVIATFVTEYAAKKIVIESENQEGEHIKSKLQGNEHILLPIESAENLDKLLELTIYLQNTSSQNPISILTVVSNDGESEVNIIKTRNKYEEFVKQASASETKVKVITTIDHNVASGILRVSRETMSDFIILRWSQKKAFILGKLIGDNLENILKRGNNMVFVCHLNKPLVNHKRIVLMIPPLAEYEKGFRIWLSKVLKLAQELTVSIEVFSNNASSHAIKSFMEDVKSSVSANYNEFDNWDDFLILSRYIHIDDLIILTSARKDTTSYMNILDKIPGKLEFHFKENNKILIYPQQYDTTHVKDSYEQVYNEPITKGIDALQKIRKGFGGLFSKSLEKKETEDKD